MVETAPKRSFFGIIQARICEVKYDKFLECCPMFGEIKLRNIILCFIIQFFNYDDRETYKTIHQTSRR